ncbi:MAG: ornithine cyclodeaminase family protein [Planctomycetota bacterium]|nr:ornithine cyclodeaminase family protein [Planctomycetota bacterium]
MRILSSNDIRHALPMSECIAAIRQAVVALSKGEFEVPERIPMESGGGISLVMSALWPEKNATSTKLISIYPDNPAKGLPTIHGLLILQDSSIGRPVALMDSASLTALRTGALCGVAAEALCKEDKPVVAIFGAGKQARTQAEAVRAVHDVSQIRIYSRTRSNVEEFVEELSEQAWCDCEVYAADSSSAAVKDADIVMCATTSSMPILNGDDIKPGAHVSAIGAFTPEDRELDSQLVQRADLLVVDTYVGALDEAGDFLIPMNEGLIRREDFSTEIGEVVAGTKTGRTSPEQITIFKSVGNAAFDVASAPIALANAERMGLGTMCEI